MLRNRLQISSRLLPFYNKLIHFKGFILKLSPLCYSNELLQNIRFRNSVAIDTYTQPVIKSSN